MIYLINAMECVITINFQRIPVALLACLSLCLGVPSWNARAIADTLQIKKPVAVGNAIQSETLEGEILIEAQDGSMLFKERDGRLRVLTSPEVLTKAIEETPSKPMTKEELGEELLAELPKGFKIHTTDDYVIAYQTERAYAKWIGNLYQGRLKRNFKKFWSKRNFKLKVEEPKFPLVAIIFATRADYAAYVQRELQTDAGTMVAYYNLLTNRVAMFDLTADQRPDNGAVQQERDIDRILRNPRVIPMVTTIIHEGTHQLMFNSGLQTRLADLPLWLNEGVAMFFEPPDLKARQGWNGPGKTNFPRLHLLKQNDRHVNALELLVQDDARFRADYDTTIAAYAESWALTHFLVNRKPAQFSQYLKFLAEKKPQQFSKPGQRLDDFKKFFGDDLAKLDKEFIEYVIRLK